MTAIKRYCLSTAIFMFLIMCILLFSMNAFLVIMDKGNDKIERYEAETNNHFFMPLFMEPLVSPFVYDFGKKGIITFIFDDGNKSIYTTAYPLLKERGLPACVAVYDSWGGTRFTVQNALEMQSSGWEVMSHSMTHLMLNSSVTQETAVYEIEQSKSVLEGYGFDVKQFVAPNSYLYTEFMPILQGAYEAGYTTHKSSATETVDNLVINQPFDKYKLYRANMQNKTLDQLKENINYAEQNKCWMVLYEHNIGIDGYTQTQTLAELADYIKTKKISVMTGSDALAASE